MQNGLYSEQAERLGGRRFHFIGNSSRGDKIPEGEERDGKEKGEEAEEGTGVSRSRRQRSPMGQRSPGALREGRGNPHHRPSIITQGGSVRAQRHWLLSRFPVPEVCLHSSHRIIAEFGC